MNPGLSALVNDSRMVEMFKITSQEINQLNEMVLGPATPATKETYVQLLFELRRKPENSEE